MKILKNLAKCILAGIVAVAILCLILMPYYLTPVHIENPEGNTDYVWPANAPWCRMTEGIAYGRFDARGYNNAEVVAHPDILVLGSSHTEAVDVLQTENFAALLGQRFRDTYTVYNMGISGHFFLKVCKYLPRTVDLYPDARYIIIETSNVDFYQSDVDSLLKGTVEYTPSNSTGLIAALQKLPFLRVVYHQLTSGLMDLLLPEKPEGNAVSQSASQSTSVRVIPDEAAYDGLFTYLRESVQGTDAQLIILYHPTGTLQQDGSLYFSDDPYLDMFSSKCQEYGFSFVDMTQPFSRMYEEEHRLAYGFITGKIGSGHLNAYGHAKIAEELSACITALKEES